MLLQAFTYQLSLKTSDEQAHESHEPPHKKLMKINEKAQGMGVAVQT